MAVKPITWFYHPTPLRWYLKESGRPERRVAMGGLTWKRVRMHLAQPDSWPIHLPQGSTEPILTSQKAKPAPESLTTPFSTEKNLLRKYSIWLPWKLRGKPPVPGYRWAISRLNKGKHPMLKSATKAQMEPWRPTRFFLFRQTTKPFQLISRIIFFLPVEQESPFLRGFLIAYHIPDQRIGFHPVLSVS